MKNLSKINNEYKFTKGFNFHLFTNSSSDILLKYFYNKISQIKKDNKLYEKIDKAIVAEESWKNNFFLDKKDSSNYFDDHELLEFSKLDDISDCIKYINYRYKYNNYPKLNLLGDYPPSLQVELSSICNYRCIMCFQIDKSFSDKKNGHMGFMDLDLYKQIIDQAEGNIDSVTLASRGEPLLNKSINKMLDYSYKKFLALKINTNLSTLDEQTAHNILSKDVQTVVFSIDTSSKENYEKIRVKGNFDNILKRLEMFSNIREKNYKNSKCIFRVSGVYLDEKQNINDMAKIFGNMVDSVGFVNYAPWENLYEQQINQVADPCTDLWRRMFIWWDGKANPCDFDYKSELSKWNFKDKSIKDIWNSKEYNFYRQSHLNKQRHKLTPCNKCHST